MAPLGGGDVLGCELLANLVFAALLFSSWPHKQSPVAWFPFDSTSIWIIIVLLIYTFAKSILGRKNWATDSRSNLDLSSLHSCRTSAWPQHESPHSFFHISTLQCLFTSQLQEKSVEESLSPTAPSHVIFVLLGRNRGTLYQVPPSSSPVPASWPPSSRASAEQSCVTNSHCLPLAFVTSIPEGSFFFHAFIGVKHCSLSLGFY